VLGVWQLDVSVDPLAQQFCPELHVVAPPSAALHAGPTHAPLEQYVEHGLPLFCQVPVALHDCGWKLPLHCF
jgi:hypothetical protein